MQGPKPRFGIDPTLPCTPSTSTPGPPPAPSVPGCSPSPAPLLHPVVPPCSLPSPLPSPTLHTTKIPTHLPVTSLGRLPSGCPRSNAAYTWAPCGECALCLPLLSWVISHDMLVGRRWSVHARFWGVRDCRALNCDKVFLLGCCYIWGIVSDPAVGLIDVCMYLFVAFRAVRGVLGVTPCCFGLCIVVLLVFYLLARPGYCDDLRVTLCCVARWTNHTLMHESFVSFMKPARLLQSSTPHTEPGPYVCSLPNIVSYQRLGMI